MDESSRLPGIMEPRRALPDLAYVGKALTLYAAGAVLAGLAMLIGMVLFFFPLDVGVFAAGICCCLLAQALWHRGLGELVCRIAPFGKGAGHDHPDHKAA